jgi:WD40 repeat protein
MKLNLNFFTAISLLITASSCHAMELTTITKPKAIGFIDNNKVVVGGENGCAIFDTKSKALLKKITPSNIQQLVTNKDIIAVIGENQTKKKPRTKLTVFDAEKGEKSWSEGINCWQQIACSSVDSNLFVSSSSFTQAGHNLIEYDYIKHETANAKEAFHMDYIADGKIACHPTQNILLYSDGTNLFTISPLASESYYNYQKNYREITPLQRIDFRIGHNDSINAGMFSPDGSKIVFSRNKEYYLYDVINAVAYEISIHQPKYITAAFHPNCPILALLAKDNSVLFWNYLTRKDLAKTHPLAKDSCKEKNRYPFAQRLAFCPKGTQLAVALTDNWTIINTPAFNKNLAAMLYVLNNNNLPQELIQIIKHHIAHPPQLSYCNLAALSKITPLPPLQPTTIKTESSRHKTEHISANWYYEEDEDDYDYDSLYTYGIIH